MNYESDVEYHGNAETVKDLNLAYIGEVEAGEGYESDVFHVEYDENTSTFYWVADGGCSCWGGIYITNLDDFDDSGNAQAVHDALNKWAGPEYEGDDYPRSGKVAAEIADLHEKIASIR